ncbi:FimB/Mfa2 family fimbrial subunit [Petrimonas sp.]|uniref:FimB/Mfa2 family fimbrial subunit n=1 Tax=Petrimonas sp. TaxID=2023866 RepID=UPI003F514DFC
MNSTNKYRLLLLAALLITGLLSSCLSEDLSDCPRPFQLTIKALDADQVDVTDTGVAGQVVLFVFDENGQIFRTITLTADEVKQHKPIDIQMEFPGHKSLKFVDWSNLDNKVDYSQITSVKQLTDLYVKLNSQNGTAQSPGDLFFGTLDVQVEYGGTEYGKSHTLEISRKTASVIITARNLPSGEGASAYSFVLRESPDTYNQNGELGGNMVSYKPTLSKNAAGHLVTPIFNVFPPTGGKAFILDVYKNGELMYSFTQGSDGAAFVPVLGKLLNIIIDFKVEISIKVVVTPWGVVYQEVEY